VCGARQRQQEEFTQSGSARLLQLGLLLYPKPGARNLWVLPVCDARLRPRLERLDPANPSCWEDVDLDGVPTTCYRMRRRQISHINKGTFLTSYAKFSQALGSRVVRECFPELWLRNNNIRAKARNTWEAHHGGIRADKFDRGPSVRACASMSIT
jgi:hypothetical protein